MPRTKESKNHVKLDSEAELSKLQKDKDRLEEGCQIEELKKLLAKGMSADDILAKPK